MRFDMFTILPIFMIGFIAIVFGTIIIGLVRQWRYNNKQPVLSVDATVVAKRTEVSGSGSSSTHFSTSTWYHVTFELQSGERIEFSLTGEEYGMVVEGDKGLLTYQGTRYFGFDRYR